MSATGQACPRPDNGIGRVDLFSAYVDGPWRALFDPTLMTFRIHLRRLLRSRVFVMTAVLVLGLGLGVNLILFNTVYALLWRPLRLSQPDRLGVVSGRRAGGELASLITGRDAWSLRDQSKIFAASGLAAPRGPVALFRDDEPIEIAAAAVDSGYFKALALRPVAGRFFGEEEDRGASPEPRAILTESAWREHFGADQSVVGRVFPVGAARRQTRVIGVAPGGATLPFVPAAGILLPLSSASAGVRQNSGDASYHAIVRLRPGITMAQASARIEAALDEKESRSTFGKWGRHWIEPLRSAVAPVDQRTILLLYGAACLLLALTSVNVASLFVARAIARMHETSVHLALGASRWQLLSGHLQEGLSVCAAGAAVAFAVEAWFRPLLPKLFPELKSVGPELLATGPVLLAFGVLMCVGTSLIVSGAAGLRIRIGGLAATLSQGGRSGPSGGRFRIALASAQVAIVLTLLTVAGLTGRSFLSAMRTNPGFDPHQVLTFQVSGSGGLPAVVDLANQMAAIPGVRGVTFSAELPVGSSIAAVTAAHAGKLVSTDPMIGYSLVGSRYFETIGARIAAGRTFTADETEGSRPVVVLNQTAARILFPGEEAIGRTVMTAFRDRCAVVGVVKNIRTDGLDRESPPMIYTPYLPGLGGLRFIVRTDGAPEKHIPFLKARARASNPALLLQRFQTLGDVVDDTVRARGLAGVLVGGFALLGLIVSSVGLYGALAAQVQRRRREIGVRIALGATGGALARTVLAEGTRIVAAGAAAGFLLSLVAARLIQRELYGVTPLDPASFLLALLLLAGAALAAIAIPAFRAARVDALRTLNVQ